LKLDLIFRIKPEAELGLLFYFEEPDLKSQNWVSGSVPLQTET
jgi:hypothetical protein